MKFVYFVQDPRDGAIRIGLARRKRLQKQLELLQLGNPGELELLGVIPARNASALMRELRAAFSDGKIRGEWYKPLPDLRGYIRSRAIMP
jgi:hypothetical protein